MNRSILSTIVLFSVVISLVGCTAQEDQTKKKKNGKNSEAQLISPYKTNISIFTEEAGEVKPRTIVKIKFDITGRIGELYKEQGDECKKGERVALIMPDIQQIETYTSAKIAYERAQVSLKTSRNTMDQQNLNYKKAIQNLEIAYQKALTEQKSAETELNEAKKLYKKGFMTKSKYNSISDAYQIAQAQVKASKTALDTYDSYDDTTEQYYISMSELEKSRLRLKSLQEYGALDSEEGVIVTSPVSGTILTRSVDIGDYIQSASSYQGGTVLYEIANIGDLIVEVPINEMDIMNVKPQSRVILTIDAITGTTFSGTVFRIFPNATEVDNIKKYTVQINPGSDFPSGLKPGMSCQIKIMTQEKINVLSVPAGAVIRDDMSKQDFVYVPIVDNGKPTFTRKKVKTGLKDTENIEIVDGLTMEEKIVKNPYALPEDLLFTKDTNANDPRRGGPGPGMR